MISLQQLKNAGQSFSKESEAPCKNSADLKEKKASFNLFIYFTCKMSVGFDHEILVLYK